MIALNSPQEKEIRHPNPLKPPQDPSFLFIFLDGITSKRFDFNFGMVVCYDDLPPLTPSNHPEPPLPLKKWEKL